MRTARTAVPGVADLWRLFGDRGIARAFDAASPRFIFSRGTQSTRPAPNDAVSSTSKRYVRQIALAGTVGGRAVVANASPIVALVAIETCGRSMRP